MSTREARHRTALALGISTGAGCQCASCGESPFDVAGKSQDILGIGWSDWHLMANRSGAVICTGCHRLMRGRGGDVVFPLRLRSFAVIDGVFVPHDRKQMWATLLHPSPGIEVLSWATSAQRQHHFTAERSTSGHLRIGSDDAVIPVSPLRMRPLVAALCDLRSGPAAKAACTRAEILSGEYRPSTIAALGAARWSQAEAQIAPWRGTAALQLYVEHCPVSDAPLSPPPPMLEREDERAIALLGPLARSSQFRNANPIQFWSSFFLRRVQRHAHRPLPQFLTRIMQDLQVEPTGEAARVVDETLRTLDASEQDALMKRIHQHTPVLIALTYEARKQKPAAVAASHELAL